MTADKVNTDSTALTLTHLQYISRAHLAHQIYPLSISVYAKKTYMIISYLGKDTSTTKITWFDLKLMVLVGTQGSDVLSASIESVGNGWRSLYKCNK
jgi:hypothetical protein